MPICMGRWGRDHVANDLPSQALLVSDVLHNLPCTETAIQDDSNTLDECKDQAASSRTDRHKFGHDITQWQSTNLANCHSATHTVSQQANDHWWAGNFVNHCTVKFKSLLWLRIHIQAKTVAVDVV